MVRIEKGFKTAFALAFVAYIAITITFSLIASFISGTFQIIDLGTYLFGSILITPPQALFIIVNNSMNLVNAYIIAELIMTIGFLLACISAAVIAGYFCGGGKKQAFSSWYLIAVISSIIIYVINIIIKNEPVIPQIVNILSTGLLNGIFYGAIAMLVNPEYF